MYVDIYIHMCSQWRAQDFDTERSKLLPLGPHGNKMKLMKFDTDKFLGPDENEIK